MTAPGRTRRHLIVTELVQNIISLDCRAIAVTLGPFRKGVIEPVRLQNRLRHIFLEKIGMMPEIIRPDPRTSAVLFTFSHKKEQIVPPQLLAADDDLFEISLQELDLLVKAEMEKAGITEQLADLSNEVCTDLRILAVPYLIRTYLETRRL